MSRDEYEMLDGQENTVTEKYLISLPYDGRGKKMTLQWAKDLAVAVKRQRCGRTKIGDESDCLL